MEPIQPKNIHHLLHMSLIKDERLGSLDPRRIYAEDYSLEKLKGLLDSFEERVCAPDLDGYFGDRNLGELITDFVRTVAQELISGSMVRNRFDIYEKMDGYGSRIDTFSLYTSWSELYTFEKQGIQSSMLYPS